jgi:hypothetical protein
LHWWKKHDQKTVADLSIGSEGEVLGLMSALQSVLLKIVVTTNMQPESLSQEVFLDEEATFAFGVDETKNEHTQGESTRWIGSMVHWKSR